MTCEDVHVRASEFVDGHLEPDMRALVAAHLERCTACEGLLRDLAAVRAAAGRLGPIQPPDHLWLELAGQLQLDRHSARAPAGGRPSASRAPIWQWVGIAAALVIVTLGVYVARRPSAPAVTTASAGNPAGTGSVETVAEELSLALEHYDKAIAELELVTKNNDGSIDPQMAEVLKRNLGIIDGAIAESRLAVASNPDSPSARDSLFEALRRKVGVLQATVSVMNEMRKGDPEGAARAAAGLGRKS
jgi:Putative zinc-finger